jgi:hypothetical protein
VVWARRRWAVSECPTSYITGESVTLLEHYYATRYFGVPDMYALPARIVDAICAIEREVNEERKYGDK